MTKSTTTSSAGSSARETVPGGFFAGVSLDPPKSSDEAPKAKSISVSALLRKQDKINRGGKAPRMTPFQPNRLERKMIIQGIRRKLFVRPVMSLNSAVENGFQYARHDYRSLTRSEYHGRLGE
eukprot:GHVU01029615.1.p3 GENE.GHVU01029615.1~~GHVU01029615.1.p3  ORF type:complete len:123 (+),score=9.36 GHVU01029615.1:412-780(+)